MTTVYIVTSGVYDSYMIEAVFSTEAAAEAYVKENLADDRYAGVDQWELDTIRSGIPYVDERVLPRYVVVFKPYSEEVQTVSLAADDAEFSVTDAYNGCITVYLQGLNEKHAIQWAKYHRAEWIRKQDEER